MVPMNQANSEIKGYMNILQELKQNTPKWILYLHKENKAFMNLPVSFVIYILYPDRLFTVVKQCMVYFQYIFDARYYMSNPNLN